LSEKRKMTANLSSLVPFFLIFRVTATWENEPISSWEERQQEPLEHSFRGALGVKKQKAMLGISANAENESISSWEKRQQEPMKHSFRGALGVKNRKQCWGSLRMPNTPHWENSGMQNVGISTKAFAFLQVRDPPLRKI